MPDKEERIRSRAYELWEIEGKPHGSHERHWLEATNQIETETTSAMPAKPKRAAATAKATPGSTPAKPAASKPAKAAVAPAPTEPTPLMGSASSVPAAKPKARSAPATRTPKPAKPKS